MDTLNKNIPAEPGTEEQDTAGREVFLRSQLKKAYGTATTSWLIYMVVLTVCSLVVMGLQNAGKADGLFFVIANLAAPLVAHICALLFGYNSLKAFSVKDPFNTPFRGKAWGFGLFAALGMQGVWIFIINILTRITGHSGMPDSVAETISMGDDPVQNVIIFTYVVLLGPVFEELVYRGFVLNALAPVNRWFAVICSALMFSLMHGNFAQIPNTFVVGIIFGYLAMKTGSIIPSVIAHIIMNFNATVTSLIYPEESYLYIHFAVTGVIGIICLVIYIMKNGKLTDEDIIVPSFKVDMPKTSENTWKIYFTRPSFWITAVYFIYNAIVLYVMSGANVG